MIATDLDANEDGLLLRESTRRFLEKETAITYIRELAATADGFERSWWNRALLLGWTAMGVSQRFGGGSITGAPTVELACIAREIGRHVAPGPFVPCNLVVAGLTRDGSSQQCEDVLPGLVTGDIVAAWCFKDGGGSWVPGEFAVTAVREEGGYRLNGVKSMVEAAPQADVLLITASAPSGPSQFLVDVGTPGVAIIPTEGLDLVRRFGDVHLVDVVVPESGLVGSEGGASSTIARQLDLASVLLSASMVGAAERVFEFTVQYAFSRYSFGRPLASYQALKHRFADMFLWLEACEATMQAAAKALDSDSAFESNTPSIAKAFVAEYAPEIIQGCVQLHGAIGVTWEHNLHLFLRRVTLDRGLYGGPDIHQDAVGAMVVGPHV